MTSLVLVTTGRLYVVMSVIITSNKDQIGNKEVPYQSTSIRSSTILKGRKE